MGLSDSSISSLLNSLGSGNNSSGSFDFANYAAIKNGSYGKLVKSYYAEQNKTSDTKTASSNAKSKTSTKTDSNKNTDTTGLTQMKKDADKLRASAEALDNDDLWKKTDGKGARIWAPCTGGKCRAIFLPPPLTCSWACS